MNAGGPLLNHAMRIFGAKCGLALHWQTTSQIVPLGGGVGVRWFTNYQALTGDFPDYIFDRLGPAKTLQQGRKCVGDQFEYASLATDTGTMSAHWLTFRQSFMVIAFTAMDRELIGRAPDEDIYVPGCLQQS